MQKLLIALAALAIIPMAAVTTLAQDDPKLEGSLGYTYVRANSSGSGFNLSGGSGSASYGILPKIDVVGDLGAYHTGNISGVPVDATIFSYMFGPRIKYRTERLEPFAQVLFGGAHLGASAFGGAASQNSFAMAVGGGLDVRLTDMLSLRTPQIEYFMTRFSSSTQNNFRLTTGVVFRFGAR